MHSEHLIALESFGAADLKKLIEIEKLSVSAEKNSPVTKSGDL